MEVLKLTNKSEQVFSPIEFYKGLRKYFKIEQPNKYLCTISLIITDRILINIFTFDDWLRSKHKTYAKAKKVSMSDFIKKEYGKDAEAFIRKYIK